MTKKEFMEKGRAVSLEDVKNLDPSITTLTPNMVANVMNTDPQWIRVMAHSNKEALGYTVQCNGRRVHIPRQAFINWMEGGGQYATA